MEKLTNEEIARVFAMYWGGKVSTVDGDGKMLTLYPKCITVALNKITFGQDLHGLDIGNGGLHRSYPHYGGACKLYLTPLSKITDEHAIKLSELINDEKFNESETFKVISEENRIVVYSSKVLHDSVDMGYRYTTTIYSDMYAIKSKPYSGIQQMPYEAYQFLIQQGYNVPLFFGINHWANAKTPIELGIAIESL